ncbi:MAG: NAD(P)H-dependent oxidoreductase subunit E [Oscillospiraceae bacterium]|jgi:NADP-reducing hydrogenase subunit HndA|nr:NAD(P)H-dependent oxidoreductase subunit E [Oscillospiraceae bacterium]
MATKTAVPFTGTAAQEERLVRIIHEIKGEKGSLMRVLQEAQEIYGYLPVEVQTLISRELGVPLERIYGVVTFYSQFSLTPKGKHQIAVCMGTACYVRGAGDILKKLRDKLGLQGDEVSPDGLFSINDCRCIGACGLAPVITIGEDVYGRLSPGGEELDGILAKYTE